MRTLRDSTLGLQPTDIIPVEQGGLGVTSATAAATSLNAIKSSELNTANGYLKKDSLTGKALAAQFPGLTSAGIALSGNTTMNGGVTTTYTLKNYDVGTTYTLSKVGNGSVSNGVTVNPTTFAATFTYTAPILKSGAAAGSDGFTLNATINGITTTRTVPVTVIELSKLSFSKSSGTSSPISVTNSSIPFIKSDGTVTSISVALGYMPFIKSNGVSTSVYLVA